MMTGWVEFLGSSNERSEYGRPEYAVTRAPACQFGRNSQPSATFSTCVRSRSDTNSSPPNDRMLRDIVYETKPPTSSAKERASMNSRPTELPSARAVSWQVSCLALQVASRSVKSLY